MACDTTPLGDLQAGYDHVIIDDYSDEAVGGVGAATSIFLADGSTDYIGSIGASSEVLVGNATDCDTYLPLDCGQTWGASYLPDWAGAGVSCIYYGDEIFANGTPPAALTSTNGYYDSDTGSYLECVSGVGFHLYLGYLTDPGTPPYYSGHELVDMWDGYKYTGIVPDGEYTGGVMVTMGCTPSSVSTLTI